MIALFLKTSLYHVDKHCEYFWTFTIIFSFEQFLFSKTQKTVSSISQGKTKPRKCIRLQKV